MKSNSCDQITCIPFSQIKTNIKPQKDQRKKPCTLILGNNPLTWRNRLNTIFQTNFKKSIRILLILVLPLLRSWLFLMNTKVRVLIKMKFSS